MICAKPKDRPDCPLDHKCEKCGKMADTVVCMYHLPTKSLIYRYMCIKCHAATYYYHMIMGLSPIDLEEVEE